MTVLTTPALAAAQPDSPPAAAEADDEDAIVITAQRRNERREDVPMAIAAADQETLTDAGATSLRDISRVVPGVMINQGGAFPQPTIRGVTTLVNGTSFENNVAVFIDGFYEPASQALGIDLPNIDNVQILKGPQGTLYGRNATGGAILINTITPGNEWEGRAEVTYGRFDDKRASGYIAGPLSDMIGVSLAGYIRRGDGYMKLTSRTTPGELDGNAAPIEQDAIRAKLNFDVSENFSATLAYNFIRTSNATANMFSVFENVGPTFLLPGGATRPTRLGTAAWDHDARIETTSHQGTLTLEWDTGVGTLKSYTGFQSFKPITSFDFDGTYINAAWSTSEFRQKTFQQAVDFAIDTIDSLDLVIGGTYFTDKLKTIGPHIANFGGLNPLDPGTTPPTFAQLGQTEDRRFRQDKEAWAVYMDATWHVTDAIHLNVGGRYSQETQDVFAQSTCFIVPGASTCAGLMPVPGGGFVAFPATNKSSTYKKFTPRASIRFQVAPRTNVYASYSQGFRSGAWNASIPLLPTGGPDVWLDADQEVVDAFEVGFKMARRNFRVELSAFYYDYKNLQVSLTTCVGEPLCTIQTIIDNAPKASVKGIEGSFEWEPMENLTLRGGATFLHARYGDGFLFAGVGVNPAAMGINVNADPLKTLRNLNQNQNLSGLQMSRAPNFAANLGVTYEIPMGEGGLRWSANANYTDSYVVTNPSVWCDASVPANAATCAGVPADRQRQQRFREGKYVLVSAAVQYTEPSGHFYGRLWVNNLTNHKYRLHYTGTSAFGSYSPMAEPRTFGITVGAKY